MTKIAILTGAEPRHAFFRKRLALAPGIEVLQSYCEGTQKSLDAVVAAQEDSPLRQWHLAQRDQSEQDFFGLFVEHAEDRSHPRFLPKGDINKPEPTQAIIGQQPDMLVAYGCSIIREPLLSAFAGRFINVHLGLSPYYRGSGTNYWPLVNNEPEYVGVTFMHIDAGIDTGEIIHQLRARVVWGDMPVQIGNRVIVDAAAACAEIARNFDALERVPQPPEPAEARVYRRRDFTEESVSRLYANFADGLVERYLAEGRERCARVPLVRNPALSKAADR